MRRIMKRLYHAWFIWFYTNTSSRAREYWCGSKYGYLRMKTAWDATSEIN